MTSVPIGTLFAEAERLQAAGQMEQVISLYKSWIALNHADPALHAIYFNYSIILAKHGDKHGAINALRESIRIKPEFSPSYINLGRTLEDIGQTGTAVGHWMDLVRLLEAVNGEKVRHKIMVLQQIGRVLEGNHVDGPAEDALKQSLEIRPNQPEVVQHWISLRQRQCKWPVFEEMEGITRESLMAHISPLSAAVMLDDPLFQLGRAWRYAKETIGVPPNPEVLDFGARRKTGRPAKLKIGYVSSDLREHAVGFGLSEVMELHDKSRFEIHAYYCGIARNDPTKERIKANVDHWTDINGVSDDDVAKKITADGIDILVDVNGYTRDARTPVFARRPAPVQVNWYGFPGTMGSPYHQYIIGDPYVIPEGSEIYYTEKVVRLPCYQPNDRKRKVADVPPTRTEEGLPEDAFVFCCLNGSQKTTPGIFSAWMQIVKAVPNSVLWLLDSNPDTNERLRRMFEANGLAREQICVAPKRPNPMHLARYRLADVFLDTFPYGAHTTASDAMWMGVPVITIPGRTFASRVCADLVTAGGTPELVCDTLEAYVAKAIDLGTNPAKAKALRKQLDDNRLTSTLFNTDLLVRSLEGLYDGMWDDFVAGKIPRPDLNNLETYDRIGVQLNSDSMPPVDNAEYLSRYEERLRKWDMTYPLVKDSRLVTWA